MRLSDVSRRRAGKTSAVRARRTERARVYVCVCALASAAAAAVVRATAAAVAASCVGVAARLRRYAAKMSWSRGHIAVPVGSVCRPPRAVLFYGRCAPRRYRGRVFPLRKSARYTARRFPYVRISAPASAPSALSSLGRSSHPRRRRRRRRLRRRSDGRVYGFPSILPLFLFFRFSFSRPSRSRPSAFFPLPTPPAHNALHGFSVSFHTVFAPDATRYYYNIIITII